MIRLIIYWFVKALAFLSLSLVLFISWLLFTSSGGYWLLQQVPGLSVQGFQGQLVNRWQVKQLQWQNTNLNLTLNELRFDWQASCLLEGKLCINNLHLATFSLLTSEENQASDTPPFDLASLRLPSIELPHLDLKTLTYLNQLKIKELKLGSFELNDEQQFTNLQLAASWQATRIDLESLALQSHWLPKQQESNAAQTTQVQLTGWLLAEDNWPLAMSLSSQFNDYPLNSTLAGDLKKLQLDTRLALSKTDKEVGVHLAGWLNLLEPAVPVDLTLAWKNLDPYKIYSQLTGWPSGLQLKKGKLTVKGDLEAGWQLNANTEQALNNLPVNLSLKTNLSWKKLLLEELRLNIGDTSWLALQLELEEATKQKFKLAGKMTGHLVTELANPTELTSEFNGFLDTATLQTTGLDYQLKLSELELITGQDQLALTLDLNPERWQTALTVKVVDFASLTEALLELVAHNLPDLLSQEETKALLAKHSLEGDLTLTSSVNMAAPLLTKLTLPQVLKKLRQGEHQLNVSAEHLSYTTTQLDKTALQINYAGLKNSDDPQLSLQLTSEQLTLQNKEQSQQEALLIQAINVDLSGLLSRHQLTTRLTLDQQPVEISIQGGMQLNSLDDLHWQYQLATLASELVKPWLPADLRWTDELEGEIKGQWKNQQLELDLALNSGPGELAVKLEDTLNKTFNWIPLTYHLLNLGIRLDNEQLKAYFTLDGEQLGYLNTEVSLALYPDAVTQQRAIKGNYQLNGLQLQLFSPFIAIEQMAGQLVGEGEIKGHLLAPELWGNLQLQEIVLADSHWPITLERLDGQLLLQGEQLVVEANFATGDGGEGELSGEMRWQPDLTASLHLKGEAFQVRVEPYASLQVTPDLTLSYQENTYSLAGRVSVPSGLIGVQQLPKQAIKVSEDAQVVGRDLPVNNASKLDLNIELLLGNAKNPDSLPLRLEALGLNAELQGRLRVTKDLQTRGELLLVNGVYQSWGQDLKLRKARLNFAGPYRLPFLDIEAVREVQDVVVGIHMTGRVDRPEAEIFSEPNMANEQALSWLILGRPLRTEKDENSLNAAAISYGLKQASGVTQRLGNTLGLKDFELIAEGGGSETSVVASGYINDRLSVRYGVGVYDDVTRFVVRYELSRQVYIEAASSLASSLDIFWRLDF